MGCPLGCPSSLQGASGFHVTFNAFLEDARLGRLPTVCAVHRSSTLILIIRREGQEFLVRHDRPVKGILKGWAVVWGGVTSSDVAKTLDIDFPIHDCKVSSLGIA